MPELAEVEFYRKQWDSGLGQKIVAAKLHSTKRVFRATDTRAMAALLRGAVFRASEARGKQMLFQFSGGLWLGVHLGMTGTLRVEPADFKPGRHDHLVLAQAGRALVFNDPRQFGRVLFHRGATAPDWWAQLPPPVTGREFTLPAMNAFLQRRRRLPIKAALLLQERFPGIGNWMADEILWRARIHPRTPAGRITGERARKLWRQVRWVSRQALAIIGKDFSDPPKSWLLNERWSRDGVCPLHRTQLQRATIGGRTTAWCGQCQGR
ncbi:MAG: Fpg/Nei family DNA glycosylase [Verrucomicrobia bacterium]|nr:Fpg/Nei family DNA glycosylase [Verrucomicrobiota bacterium]